MDTSKQQTTETTNLVPEDSTMRMCACTAAEYSREEEVQELGVRAGQANKPTCCLGHPWFLRFNPTGLREQSTIFIPTYQWAV